MGAELTPRSGERITLEFVWPNGHKDRVRFGRHVKHATMLCRTVQSESGRTFWRLLDANEWQGLPEGVRQKLAAHFGLPHRPSGRDTRGETNG